MYQSGLRLLVWVGPSHRRKRGAPVHRRTLGLKLPLLPWTLCHLITLESIMVHIAVDSVLFQIPKQGDKVIQALMLF